MATSTDLALGHSCEFIDSVPEDFYCKKCTLVARRLTVCNSCMKSYCYACITDTQKQGQPCPTCGKRMYEHVKNQKQINCLRVYCSMKEKGCDWSGTLEQLDTHLDPDQDNCQYVDTKCPLNCHQTIPKNKVEQHVAQHCAKRPHVCQYRSFKEQEKKIKEQGMEIKNVSKEQDQFLSKKFGQKVSDFFKRLTAKSEHSEATDITKELQIEQLFEVNYSTEIKSEYTSPAMYTHLHGYKFYARVYVSVHNHLCVVLRSMPGEYDDQLQWPARAKFTIELINQQGGESAVPPKDTRVWNKPEEESNIASGTHILKTSKLGDFLVNNTLHFHIQVELI